MCDLKQVMKNIIPKLLLLIISLCSAQAGVFTISGVYQGKNLYVQNPFTGNLKDFCTEDVFVNDVKVMSNIKSSAYEIDLSHLKMNDPVDIKITHKDDCKPKVLNPQVIRVNSAFQFISFNVDAESLSWVTKGEKTNGKVFIEQFLNNSWLAVKEIPGKGSATINNYSLEEIHHSGLNKYRVKYLEKDGQVFYSKVVEFTSSKQPVAFYPKRVTSKVTLTRAVPFEVIDSYGNSVKKGSGMEIDMSDLKEGVYYLNFDNRTEKVLKK